MLLIAPDHPASLPILAPYFHGPIPGAGQQIVIAWTERNGVVLQLNLADPRARFCYKIGQAPIRYPAAPGLVQAPYKVFLNPSEAGQITSAGTEDNFGIPCANLMPGQNWPGRIKPDHFNIPIDNTGRSTGEQQPVPGRTELDISNDTVRINDPEPLPATPPIQRKDQHFPPILVGQMLF